VVAVCSGLIIFPACSAFGVSVDSGPSLLFITLPNVFNNLAGGRIWGTLFFLFMNFASFSTILAVFENIVSGCMELFNISRKKACLINIFVMILLSMPCAIGFNLLSFIQPLGEGTTILDLEDYIVSNWLLPLGSLVFVLFCTYKFGWGWENFLNEANEGKGLKVRSWMKLYMQIVLPIVLIVIFILGII
jgi:NSS family neurotransmitter:Na+ symporter